MKIRIADFKIEVKNKFSLIEKQCKDYIDEFDSADFVIETTKEDIEAEKLRPYYKECFKDAYLEAANIHRKICFFLPETDAIMLHGAVFSLEGRTVALVANSGVGKTTHMMFYKKLFGDKVTIINGDKPFIRYRDSKLYAYGTPWCGKEGINTNTKAELTDICFITRDEKNDTHPITKSEAATRIFSQVYLPKTKNAAENTLKMLDTVLNNCNLWEIKCRNEEAAAKVSYEAIFKGGSKK